MTSVLASLSSSASQFHNGLKKKSLGSELIATIGSITHGILSHRLLGLMMLLSVKHMKLKPESLLLPLEICLSHQILLWELTGQNQLLRWLKPQELTVLLLTMSLLSHKEIRKWNNTSKLLTKQTSLSKIQILDTKFQFALPGALAFLTESMVEHTTTKRYQMRLISCMWCNMTPDLKYSINV